MSTYEAEFANAAAYIQYAATTCCCKEINGQLCYVNGSPVADGQRAHGCGEQCVKSGIVGEEGSICRRSGIHSSEKMREMRWRELTHLSSRM